MSAAPRAGIPAGGTRSALRAATHDAHERLHAIPVMHRLAQGGITRAEYADLLQRMLRFHLIVERCLRRGPALAGHDIELRERMRSGLLRRDIAALGLRPVRLTAGDETVLAEPCSVAASFGYLYVTEGSTLGGRMLARALDPVLGRDQSRGRSFLLGYGDRHAAMWRKLCLALESVGDSTEACGAMAEAASAAFSCFEACVSADGVTPSCAPQGLDLARTGVSAIVAPDPVRASSASGDGRPTAVLDGNCQAAANA